MRGRNMGGGLRTALERLRWRDFDPGETPGSVDRASMARAFAYLFGAGATLVLATLALPSVNHAAPGTVIPPLVAYGVVVLCLWRFDRLPLWAFRALPAFGAVLVTAVAFWSEDTTFNAYALLYSWVIISAFYFFAWWQAFPSLVVIAAGYAAVLLRHDETSDRLLYWVMGIGTALVASLLLSLLRERSKRLVMALTESDLLKTTLLRSVSHDLRTPLTAIIAAGESSASPSLDPASRGEVAAVIVGEAERLAQMVDKLLDISRLEGGAVTPRRSWCSLEEVIEAALERTSGEHERFAVGEVATLPEVWADAAQLERAFANLLENASRYARRPVDIGFGVNGDRVVVTIADDGPGVDESERELIFEPFYRGRADGSAHRGPGLGLAIAKGFIEVNGGSVRVATRPGPGATFVVELPSARPPD